MLAKDTLPEGTPVGSEIPIDHIVVIIQENRSFDHYLSGLAGADVASPDVTNPDTNGNPVKRFHQTQACFNDTNHQWDGMHAELDSGKLDGFVVANQGARYDPTGVRGMGYYDRTDLPFLYGLAEAFAVSDRHFCSVLGPTYPNRLYFMGGSSLGLTESFLPPPHDAHGNPYPNYMLALNAAGVSWMSYDQDFAPELLYLDTWSANMDHFASPEPCLNGPCRNFVDDARLGQLPQVSTIDASDGSTTYPIPVDEHPASYPAVGQQWLSNILSAAMHSPQWPHMAIFLTYDESGGLYDHVVPPAAVPPDDIPPDSGTFAFNQLGFRVPFIVISPYARRGHISHVVTDHTSIMRFIEARFGLPAMSRRDANAQPPYDMFDFSHHDTAIPDLPVPTVDPTIAQACISEFPQSSSGLF